MTGKERAAWRAKANKLDVLFQLGKSGVTDAFIEQVDGALNARELIKFKVLLETSPVTAREAADIVSEKTGSEVIQVIGGVVVLYRENKELHESEKAKARAKAKAKAKKTALKDTKYTRAQRRKDAVPTRKEQKDAARRKAAAARKLGR